VIRVHQVREAGRRAACQAEVALSHIPSGRRVVDMARDSGLALMQSPTGLA
jgi:hypothetical protein